MALALTVVTAVSFAGTGFAQDTAEEALPVIGEDLSGQNYGFVIDNETGKEITGAAVRINYGEFSDELLDEEMTIADGEKVQLLCTPGEMVNYVPAMYDLRLTFADDTEAVLHTLPMGDAKEIEVLTDEDVTYIRFTSLSLNYETDTLRRETEISEIGEAVLIADYNAKITYTGGGYSGGGSSGGGGGQSSGSGQGTGDGCLTDGILF